MLLYIIIIFQHTIVMNTKQCIYTLITIQETGHNADQPSACPPSEQRGEQRISSLSTGKRYILLLVLYLTLY